MLERKELGKAVDCTDVAGLLPVYMNRSLEKDVARQVAVHLATCAACRQEERDTRTVGALYEGHLPVELLVAYALAEEMSGQAQAVVESHLAVCERCSEEVATVRQDTVPGEPASGATQAGPALGGPRSAAQTGRGPLRTLAWAACLAAVVASAAWLRTWRQLVDERALATVQTAVSSPAARVNLSVVELLPAAQPLLRQGSRGPRDAANRVELSDDAGELVLVLLSGGRWCESGCILEVYEDGQAQPKWRVEGLVASPDRHLTLALPGDWLPPERSVLAVLEQASGKLVAEYLIEIQPATGVR